MKRGSLKKLVSIVLCVCFTLIVGLIPAQAVEGEISETGPKIANPRNLSGLLSDSEFAIAYVQSQFPDKTEFTFKQANKIVLQYLASVLVTSDSEIGTLGTPTEEYADYYLKMNNVSYLQMMGLRGQMYNGRAFEVIWMQDITASIPKHLNICREIYKEMGFDVEPSLHIVSNDFQSLYYATHESGYDFVYDFGDV